MSEHKVEKKIFCFQVDYGVYLRYFKSVGLTFSLVVLIGTIANQAFAIYSNTWLADWADDEESNDPATRDLYLGVYGALGIAQCKYNFNKKVLYANEMKIFFFVSPYFVCNINCYGSRLCSCGKKSSQQFTSSDNAFTHGFLRYYTARTNREPIL